MAEAVGAPAAELPQQDESTKLFQKSWSLYTKLVASNFMEHAELFGALRELLQARFGGRPGLDLLDLGCGDCAHTGAALAAAAPPLALRSFTGVDASAAALDEAAAALKTLLPAACAVSLVQGDLKEFTRDAEPARFDVVIAAFSLHHLSLAEKAAFVAAAARCLRPGGALAIVDIFRREGEDLEQYQERYHHNMHDNLPGILSEEELASVAEHVRGFDRPEAVSDYRRLAAAAGFAGAECCFTDSKEFGRLVALTR